MSSMRNAVQRRNHKERAQPLERQKWGLLEKHKDYSLRAKDHNVKKRKLSALKQKAGERNEDEFYFGMMSSKTVNGVKVTKRSAENSGGGGKLSEDVVRLMKTQDVAYLRTVLQSTRRGRQKLEKEVVLGVMGVKPRPQKIAGRVAFNEDGTEASQSSKRRRLSLEDAFDDEDMDVLEATEGTLVSDGESESQPDKPLSAEERKRRTNKRHAQEIRERRLEALKEREEDLTTALNEVEHQRARMGGSIGGVNRNGVKFKVRERKG